ncbi:rRNA processing protein Rrp5/programmed cell death protein 11 [Volvox carteri f. nagariensis]|uniref:rRNA processing protein Rrp5/programmed cell death protein 11 n=1 Tax=Volvox carteri f. nagariensis TaxID=3068 RepID=D8U606_VOLCA|nr:rRNA processing protein Rrp5/programmed cell death protein 11 [Volvox carteri f. nagariensis]EFJ44854.1 rRNA processing protein Rrp5/programmed cell death protein 11 [Volvox carteri f. nagariensis]|eukprot:XP_002954137.1 rRNA processing protein Rrp5/programmed cell death protein 11 [Volvox carteri f. nagariensis]
MAGQQSQKKRRSAGGAVPHEQEAPQAKRPNQRLEEPTRNPFAVKEEDFPRGGADTLTALERRELTEAARREVEQELADGKQPKSKKARLSKQEDEEDTFFRKHAAAVEGKLAKHVDLLRVKDLHAGTRVWGMVLEVTPRGLVVSLAHGLRGYVAPNQASDVLALMLKAQKTAAAAAAGDRGDVARKKGAALLEAAGGVVPPLTDLFVVGQFVRGVVMEAPTGEDTGGGRSAKHVALSLLLRDVQGGLGSEAVAEGLALGAVVRSVEDHGYTLSFGIKGTSGFLRKKDHEAQFGEGVALQVGGLIDVVVRNAADKRNVLVSCAPGDVAAAVTREAEGMSGLGAVLPGALLNVKVRKVLSNGLLVSFLTFFHGTVDLYHLPAASAAAAAAATGGAAGSKDWRKLYPEGTKLRARLLYADLVRKRAGLSLLPHLAAQTLPSPVPVLGSVFPEAEVVRLDAAGGPGLLLRMEGLPEGPVAGYCHVSNALEEKKVAKEAVAAMAEKYKVGTKLPARVIGYRLLDGMASVTVRPSQVNAAVLSFTDLTPGMLVAGTVISVPDRDGDGPLLVQIAEGVKGLVPPLHASELTGAAAAAAGKTSGGKRRIKVKVGDRVEARVLDLDLGARKVTLTLRKAFLATKAAPLVSAAQAVPGSRFHGMVTGLHDRLGVFVSFFSGLSGLASHDDLGLEPGQDVKEAFGIGQVVRATILSTAGGRIKLSLASKSAAAEAAAAAASNGISTPDLLGGLQPGDIAEAVVLKVHNGGEGGDAASSATPFYTCRLERPGVSGGGSVPLGVRARLEVPHLSDHPAALEAFRAVVRPGTKLGRVVVLERLEAARCVRVSRKPSLLAAGAAGRLPRRFEEVVEGAVLPGYVASVTPDAVYVRFLGGLTGRAGLPQLSDVFVSEPRLLFAEGQSVRAQVAVCDAARQRFTLMLRPSVTASTDGAFLLDYFKEMQQLQALRAEAEAEPGGGGGGGDGAAGNGAANGGSAAPPADLDPARVFPLGGLAAARVHEVKEYGIVCDMDEHPDVVGLVPSSHAGALGPSPAVGTRVRGRVLDVVGHQGLVELSLKPGMVAAAEDGAAGRAAARQLKPGVAVEAVVEGIRPGEYLILSLPQHSAALAYAAVTDYNTPRPDLVPRTFTVGQRLTATVAATPPDAPLGRIVCHVPLTRIGGGAGGKGAAASGGKKVTLDPGSVVEAVVTGIQPYQLDVSVCGGKTVEAVVLGRLQTGEGHRPGSVWDLSLRPSRLAKAKKGEPPVPSVTLSSLAPGQQLPCFVLEVAEDALWLGAGPAVRGRVAALDASLDPDVLTDLSSTFPPGTVVLARVLAVSRKRNSLDLSLIDPCSGTTRGSVAGGGAAATTAAPLPPEGALVMGRILAANGGGVRVSIGHRRAGSVALTDIYDEWVPDARAGLREGAYVRVRVLGRDGDFAVLSLRPSRGGAVAGSKPSVTAAGSKKQGGSSSSATAAAAPELISADSLKVGATVTGYVKRCDAKGLFLALDRFRDGHIKLVNLSDGFIEDPAAAFPAGMQLEARVLRVGEGGRIELTLRSATRQTSGSAAPAVQSLSELRPGQLVSGRVRRVERFGVFVEVGGNPGLVGLAHISELADGPVKDINSVFKSKQLVRAVVTKVDVEASRLSLSMKPSTINEAEKAEAEAGGAGDSGGGAGGGKKKGVKRQRGASDIDSEIAEAGADEDDDDDDGEILLSFSCFSYWLRVMGSAGGAMRPPQGLEDGAAAAAAGAAAGSSEDDDDDDDEMGEDGEGGARAMGSDGDVDDVEVSDDDNDDDDDDDDDEEEEEEEEGDGDEEEEQGGAALARSRPGTTIAAGNLDLTAPWGELLLADDPRVAGGAAGAGPGSDLAAAADGEGSKKLSKGQKKRLKEQRELEIRAAELARLSGSAAATGPADFERLVLSSPNSSFVWIKYMALHLGKGDVDAARKVAQRALDTINYREEGEKFNVWVAWLNLENAYGSSPSPEEAVMELLKRALQYTDQKKMYLAALGIFERSGRDDLAEQVVRTLTKKFGGSAKVWARALERSLQKGDGETPIFISYVPPSPVPYANFLRALRVAQSARQLLERALQSLPPRKHIKALVRAALAEFRLGSAERGRGILEGVLRNYPKRLDLWNVYIDQELKTGEQQRIRALFERATHLPLPPKKMKFLFRRYLEYEKEEGDTAAVEHVKRRAMEFVESSLKA